jgi:hypothetical protein
MSDLRALQQLEHQFWRAPSAHNTQPWQLAYGADRIELEFDRKRALPAGDPTERDLLLSLGAFVETVLIVAAHAGRPLQFTGGFDPGSQRVGFFTPTDAPYASPFTPDDVARRQTSRLRYVEARLAPEELADARGQVPPDAELHEVATRDLVDLLVAGDRHLYETPDVVEELRSWLRLSPGHPRYEVDGLSYDCLDLTRVEASAVALLLRPRVYPLVRATRLHTSFSVSTRKLLEHDGSALVLAASSGSPDEILTHGRTLNRIWLSLARRGVYTHPLSQILDCPATERALASLLGTSADRRLLSVFRAGRSELPPRSHRLR